MAAKKLIKVKAVDPKSITLDDLVRVFSMHFNREVKRRVSDFPDAPFKVEDVTTSSPSEISHIRSHYKNPERVEGVITLALPESLRNRGRQGKIAKTPSRKK